MLARFAYGVFYAIVVLAVTWVLTVLLRIIPIPGGLGDVFVTIIWVIGFLIAVAILLRLLFPAFRPGALGE